MQSINMKIDVQSITTKFGTGKLNNYGYWEITSRKEGNHHKKLHRLFFEDYHKCTLLPNAVIHHRDNNKLNNQYENLELMTREDHLSLHHTGKSHSYDSKIKMSEAKNTTGYFRVSKQKDKMCKQGFIWCYQYSENGKHKSIYSVDIKKLEAKVKAKGLPWKKFDEGGK